MCLAVPGELIERLDAGPMPMGRVRFDKSDETVCLAFVPETQVGDFVIAHAGFAITRLDANEAQARLDMLRQMQADGGV